MQTFATIIIFVSILGCCLIVALVWLFYKYKAVKAANAVAATDLPPTRKLTIVRGRVVDASKAFTPSIMSSWSSLRSSVRRIPSSIGSAEKHFLPSSHPVGKSRLSTVAWSPEEDLEKGELAATATRGHEAFVSLPSRAHASPIPRPRPADERASPLNSRLRYSIVDCLASAQSPDMSPPPTANSTTPLNQSTTSPVAQTRLPLQSKFQIGVDHPLEFHPPSSRHDTRTANAT